MKKLKKDGPGENVFLPAGYYRAQACSNFDCRYKAVWAIKIDPREAREPSDDQLPSQPVTCPICHTQTTILKLRLDSLMVGYPNDGPVTKQ